MSTQEEIRIVLAEDDPAQARLYAEVLNRKLGGSFHLEMFCDAVQAARHLQTHLIDVLITDLQMPNVDGLKLIRSAKERHRGVQVIVLTACSTTDSLIDAADLGAADYLMKPFSHGLLVDVVEQAADRVRRWRSALADTLHGAAT